MHEQWFHSIMVEVDKMNVIEQHINIVQVIIELAMFELFMVLGNVFLSSVMTRVWLLSDKMTLR